MSNFEYFSVLLSTSRYFLVILSIFGYFCGPPFEKKPVFPPYFYVPLSILVISGTTVYLWVILSICLYFWLLLGTFLVILSIFGYFCGPPCEKNLCSPLTFMYFWELFGSLGYLWVILSIFLYFWVLLGTFWSFWVFLATFVGPPVKKMWSPLHLCTFEYFLVLLGTYE